MSTVNWPSVLPTPTVKGYSYEFYDPIVRTEMDSGTIRSRRRFQTVPLRSNLRFIMNELELGIFESFYTNTIRYGADWFRMNLTTGDGSGLKEIRFMSVYKAKPVSGKSVWEITVPIEVREIQSLPTEFLSLFTIDGWSGDSFRVNSDSLDRLINTTLPQEVWT